jgi:hypothetical protein
VEATLEEAAAHVYPRLTEAQRERAERNARRGWGFASSIGDPPRPYCFLVADDLSSVDPHYSRYPCHQFWAAYSPFGEFADRWIETLEDLRTLDLPKEINWIGILNYEKYGDTYPWGELPDADPDVD